MIKSMMFNDHILYGFTVWLSIYFWPWIAEKNLKPVITLLVTHCHFHSDSGAPRTLKPQANAKKIGYVIDIFV